MKRKPERVVTDYLRVPDDNMNIHQDIAFLIDEMMVDKIMFLMTSSHNIQFTTVTNVAIEAQGPSEKRMFMVINLYAKRDLWLPHAYLI
jgi:hypothetical protein